MKPIGPSKEVHLVGPYQCLSLNKDQEREQIEDGFLNPVWTLRVPGNSV